MAIFGGLFATILSLVIICSVNGQYITVDNGTLVLSIPGATLTLASELNKGSGSLSTTADTTEKQYAVAYAVSPTLTVAYREDRADGSGQAEKAKIKSLQLGYNLGPVALIAGVADVTNVQGTTSVLEDARVGFVQLRGAF